MRAARAAEAAFGLAEALGHWEQVIGLWDEVPDARERAGEPLARVLARAAEHADDTGRCRHAVRLTRHAIDLLDEATEPVEVALLHERLAGAVESWLRGTCGPDYRSTVDRRLPESTARAVRDADTFFGQELPAVREWSFGPDEASRISQPVLAVLGARSPEVSPAFEQRHQLLMAWLSNVEAFVLPGATHLLHLHNLRGMAEAMARFFTRHPL